MSLRDQIRKAGPAVHYGSQDQSVDALEALREESAMNKAQSTPQLGEPLSFARSNGSVTAFASSSVYPPTRSNNTSSSSLSLGTAQYVQQSPAAMSASVGAAPPHLRPDVENVSTRPSLHQNQSQVPDALIFGTPPPPAAVLASMGRKRPRAIVRVERDYTSGELCQFWSGWMWEFEGRLTPSEYQRVLDDLNGVLASAYDPKKSIFDNCVAVLTLYLSPRILGTHYQREMARFHTVLDRANRELLHPKGLNMLSPKKNAFLFLEIEYY